MSPAGKRQLQREAARVNPEPSTVNCPPETITVTATSNHQTTVLRKPYVALAHSGAATSFFGANWWKNAKKQ